MWKKKFILIILVLVVISFSQDLMAQCSQCKLLAEQNAADDEILGTKSANINSAIIYIMIIPYVALSILFRKQIKGFLKKVFKTA